MKSTPCHSWDKYINSSLVVMSVVGSIVQCLRSLEGNCCEMVFTTQAASLLTVNVDVIARLTQLLPGDGVLTGFSLSSSSEFA